MKLWLVRHARPEIAPGICYGSTDLAADAGATLAAANALAALLPQKTRVAASPLGRCAQLAAALQTLRPDLRLAVDVRLQEMDFGAWEGQAWSAIARAELDAWTADFAGHQTGGHGESVSGFMERVAQAFDGLRDAGGGNNVLWVTHAGVIRAASLIASGRRSPQRADEWPSDAPGFGQWRILDLDEEVHNRQLPAS